MATPLFRHMQCGVCGLLRAPIFCIFPPIVELDLSLSRSRLALLRAGEQFDISFYAPPPPAENALLIAVVGRMGEFEIRSGKEMDRGINMGIFTEE